MIVNSIRNFHLFPEACVHKTQFVVVVNCVHTRFNYMTSATAAGTAAAIWFDILELI